MALRYPAFAENLRRYLTTWGDYPYRCRVRTPLGEVAPTLFTGDDVRTVNEIFCRGDYACGRDVGVVVDVGANIGISALYFLTRNSDCHVYCYEPNPVNVERLRENLSAYTGRYSIEEVAIWTHDGEVPFLTEPTGRYGRVDDGAGSRTVACRDINSVIDDVVAREGRIGVLKIDTEGSEEALVRSIRQDLLARIDTLLYESVRPMPLHTEMFRHRRQSDVNRLTLAP
jgi:FkbM family methyltransferase